MSKKAMGFVVLLGAILLLTLVIGLPLTSVLAQEITSPKLTGNTGFRNLPPNGIRNYFVYVQPSIKGSYDPNISVVDATSYWEQTNDVKFKFVTEPGQSSVMIRWIKESNGPYAAYTISNSLIEVGLGDSRCNGIWHQYDKEFTTSLLKHELGHVLGYKHSNDPTNIMYPLIHGAKYASFEETYQMTQDRPFFVPTCSFNDISSFHYKITGGSNNQLNAFFVDSEKQYTQLLKSQQFSYYKPDGCHVTNVNNYEGTCENVSGNSGLIITSNKDTHSDQKITIFVEELR